MIDMTDTIIPKSDQLNADDLISGPMTLKITGVKKNNSEQSVSIDYEGGSGKPWKPCLGMRRLLVHAYGSNGEKYIGRTVIVYRDPSVKWAGQEYGGIRVSHMDGVKCDFKFPLTIAKGKRILHPVKKLIINAKKVTEEILAKFKSDVEKAEDLKTLEEVGGAIGNAGYDEEGIAKLKEIYREASRKLRESK